MRGFVKLTDREGDALYVRTTLFEILNRYQDSRDFPGGITELTLTNGKTRYVRETPEQIAALLSEEEEAVEYAFDVVEEVRGLVMSVGALTQAELQAPTDATLADMQMLVEIQHAVGIGPIQGSGKWVVSQWRMDDRKEFRRHCWVPGRVVAWDHRSTLVSAADLLATDWQEVVGSRTEGGTA